LHRTRYISPDDLPRCILEDVEMSDLYQLGRRLTELAYQGMGGSELDLTASEFLVLRDLFMNGRSSITDTVGRTGLAQSKVSTSVAKLRDRGWVQTSPDPRDGRKTLAAVTDEVKLQGDRRRARNAADALDMVLAGADPRERRQLAAALERLTELLVGPHRGKVRTLASERAMPRGA
jgi:MarR family 2-MHQ and catechol resistance regulon transcriptional repressor